MPYDTPDAPNGYGTPSTGTPSTDRDTAYRALKSAYQRYLKRDGSESEYESHLGGRYDQDSIRRAVQAILASPEAQTVRVSTPTGTEPPSTTPGGTPATGGQGFSREERDKLTWGNVGRMEGFRVGYDYEGDTKARNSVKNTFGRIASRYPATPQGLRQVMQDPDFKRAFPNARLIEDRTGDKIDFGDLKSDFETGSPVGLVDVGRAFAGEGQTEQTGWQWLPQTTSAQAYSAVQNAVLNPEDPRLQPGVESRNTVPDAVLGQDPFAQYMANLERQWQEYQRVLQSQTGLPPDLPSTPFF